MTAALSVKPSEDGRPDSAIASLRRQFGIAPIERSDVAAWIDHVEMRLRTYALRLAERDARIAELEGALAGERVLRDVQEARHNHARAAWQTSIDRTAGDLTLARHELADARREIQRLTRPGPTP